MVYPTGYFKIIESKFSCCFSD